MEDTVFEKIYKVVRKIPRGKVATYGQIAALAGNPRWARVVGYALHVNPDPSEIPCYRVVNRQGKASAAFAFRFLAQTAPGHHRGDPGGHLRRYGQGRSGGL